MSRSIIIRPECATDADAIRSVLVQAFESSAEANLVDDLRTDGELVISLGAEVDGVILGNVAMSRLKSPERALALAPVAVVPPAQSQGVGTALIRQAVEYARQQGASLVFVLGEPEYYRRFGFSVDEASAFECEYAGPNFMALHLSDTAPKAGAVIYATAFGKL